MPSAFIPSRLGYSAMPLVRQQIHQRPVHPGPLVLRTAPLKYLTPTPDRDRTVSRRSEPSSRTALMGEQPNPWGPTSAPGCDEPTSRCQTTPSKRPLCTLRMVSNHSEGTFERLRYPFGGDRPSQTPHLTLSPAGSRLLVRNPVLQGWYPNSGSMATGVTTSKPPTYPVHAIPNPSIKLE